jgi:hypothetical protein
VPENEEDSVTTLMFFMHCAHLAACLHGSSVLASRVKHDKYPTPWRKARHTALQHSSLMPPRKIVQGLFQDYERHLTLGVIVRDVPDNEPHLIESAARRALGGHSNKFAAYINTRICMITGRRQRSNESPIAAAKF